MRMSAGKTSRRTTSGHTTLLQLAKPDAANLRWGEVGPGLQTAQATITGQPEIGLPALDLLFAEMRKTRPNGELCNAMIFLFGEALNAAWMALEASRPLFYRYPRMTIRRTDAVLRDRLPARRAVPS